MMSFKLLVLLGCCASAFGGEVENPIRKVVGLMKDMQKEIEGELATEKKLFEEFMCYCTTTEQELTDAGEKANANVKELTSKLEEETAEKGQLTEELKGHYADKEAAETDLHKATTIRQKEQADEEQSIKDSQFNIQALGKAIPAIEKGAGSAVLMQGVDGVRVKQLVETTPTIDSTARQMVLSFLSGKSDDPQSGQVLGILKQMKADMEQGVKEAIASEEAAKKAFADLKGAKDREIEVASEAVESKEKRVGELTVSISQNTDSLEDNQAEATDSAKFLTMLKTQCKEKNKLWEARLKLRHDEIKAISEAMSILNDDDARDVFKKVSDSFAQTNTGKTGFLQQQEQKKAAQLQRAQAILAEAAKAHKDLQLDFLLSKMSGTLRAAQKGKSKEGPDFSAVVKMIDNMVDVLSKEQTDDEKKKAWCVDELQKADATEKKKQETMDTLTSTIEELSDEMAGISDEVKTLQKQVADLDKSVATATEQRKKEHAEYVDTLSMTEAAVQLVGKAKDRLAKFYNPPKAKAESFLQVSRHVATHRVAPIDVPDLPELKKSSNGGVVGMMDEIIHDLEMDMQEAKFDEKQAQTEYVALMAESQTARAQDQKSIVDKKNSRSTLEEKLVEAKEQREMAYNELNNAHTYVSELHASCDFVVENFGLRSQARANEMESLKNAKAVMQGA